MENLVKFKRSLTLQEYNNLSVKDPDTLYFITRGGNQIYLGSKLVGEGNTVTSVNGQTGDITILDNALSIYGEGAYSDEHVAYVPSVGGSIYVGPDFILEQDGGSVVKLDLRKVTDSLTEGSGYDDYLVNKKYVDDKISEGFATADALVYKGSINIDLKSIEANTLFTPAANAGWVYKVISKTGITERGTINGERVEVGDMLICNHDNTPAATIDNYTQVAKNWDIIQRNEDGVVSGPERSADNAIVVFNGTSGKVVKNSYVLISDVSDAIDSVSELIETLTWD